MTEVIKIADQLAIEAPELLANLGFKNKVILFVSDQKIWQNCQKFFAKNFLENVSQALILEDPKADEKNLQKILLAFESKKFDLILALGSGTVGDLCKLTSAQKKIPYAIFASAPSMNGYLSRNASLIVAGHKKTLPATLPIAVFADLKILSAAPIELIKAGIGDALCFYSCWFDWYLSHLILGSKFDERPFVLLAEKMKFLVENFAQFSLLDRRFLEILTEILLLSGQGMTMAGGSYPASQSEHLIAHTIEMKYPQKVKDILHGQQIAITSLTAAEIQEKLLSRHPWFAKQTEDLVKKDLKKKLTDFFGKKIAGECLKEFQEKIFDEDRISEINTLLQREWPSYRQKLAEILFPASRLKAIFSHFKIKTSYRAFGLSLQEYQACVAHAKFIRNRLTCLDLTKQNDCYKNLLKAIKNEGKGRRIVLKSNMDIDELFKRSVQLKNSDLITLPLREGRMAKPFGEGSKT